MLKRGLPAAMQAAATGLFLFIQFLQYRHSSAAHIELNSLLGRCDFGINVRACLADVGKCNTYSVTCVIIERTCNVGRRMGSKFYNLGIDCIAAKEINAYIVCF